ncbi:hypothetical protein LPB137_00460 [Poseidonibacter parvus]|uniref:Periplasmic protein n=1 Tax=Poseidonibacter parvus TaxID=1850254 RepID=A0A1P8KIM9_9BACT|nr:hypothetical protein [Poseidonibacter parvus]APW64410.1 hypothetical protein LPB137_00460 [Poseidonibacter parvus]
MIKNLILIIVCTITLNANINTPIKNILGNSAFNKHKNLINYIFKNNSSAYYTNGQVNYIALTSKLQSNGLLKLKYRTSRYIDVSFKISDNPKKSLMILQDSLKSLGHYYYLVQDAKYDGNSFIWNIKLKTEAAINPLRLSKALAKNNCKVSFIKKEGTYNWRYSIISDNSVIKKSKDLVNNNQLSLKKPLKPYMLKVANANSINIISKSGNRWHPNVVFYDNDLKIIENFKDDSLHQNLKVDVPNNTTYIKIDDLYSLANLKRGISITKE